MAKFISSTFGRISGRHGTAVAAVRDGETVLKLYTRPSNPNTQAQQSQRLKFGLVANALNPLRNIITIGFGSKHGYFQASSLALRNAVSGTFPDFSINYAKVILSSGSLPQSPQVNIAAQAIMNVSVEWDNTVWGNGSAGDAVHVGFLNAATQTIVFLQAQAKREDGRLTAVLPATWQGASIHTWLFFTTADGKQSSVSQYLGTITPV